METTKGAAAGSAPALMIIHLPQKIVVIPCGFLNIVLRLWVLLSFFLCFARQAFCFLVAVSLDSCSCCDFLDFLFCASVSCHCRIGEPQSATIWLRGAVEGEGAHMHSPSVEKIRY